MFDKLKKLFGASGERTSLLNAANMPPDVIPKRSNYAATNTATPPSSNICGTTIHKVTRALEGKSDYKQF